MKSLIHQSSSWISSRFTIQSLKCSFKFHAIRKLLVCFFSQNVDNATPVLCYHFGLSTSPNTFSHPQGLWVWGLNNWPLESFRCVGHVLFSSKYLGCKGVYLPSTHQIISTFLNIRHLNYWDIQLPISRIKLILFWSNHRKEKTYIQKAEGTCTFL